MIKEMPNVTVVVFELLMWYQTKSYGRLTGYIN